MTQSPFFRSLCRALFLCVFVLIAPGLYALESSADDFSECVDHAQRGLVSARPAEVIETTLAGVPVLIRMPLQVERAPILLWHGLGPPGDKTALMDALPLDGVPAVKVYLDLPLFGDRLPEGGLADLIERQERDYGLAVFAPVVLGAARELPAVVIALNDRLGLAPDRPVSLFGFSAGGAAALTALAERKIGIESAVILNAPNGLAGGVAAFERITGASYAWTTEARRIADLTDALQRAEDIAAGSPPPALLLIHGSEDGMIPAESAKGVEQALRPFYSRASVTDRLALDVQPGLEHHWVQQGDFELTVLRDRIASWLSCE